MSANQSKAGATRPEATSVHLTSTVLEEMAPVEFRETLLLLGRLDQLKSARNVFVKANLCAGGARGPENGVNVAVDTVASLVDLLLEVNPQVRILVGDSDSTGMGFAQAKFENLGLIDMAATRENVDLVDLSRTPASTIEHEGGRLRRFSLPCVVLDADFVISLAKIKTHNIVGITGSLKNHFGSLPEMRKDVHHPFLHQVIVDVNSWIRTDLTILDGNPAMEGDGPVRGTAKPMGLTILGNNPVASDAVMAKVMQLYPQRIPYLWLANRRGLGPINTEQISLTGKSLDLFTTKFRPVPLVVRVVMKCALSIQRLGQWLVDFGHQFHRLSALSDLPRVRNYLRRSVFSAKTRSER